LTLTACGPSIGYQTHDRCRGVLWFGECYRDEAEKSDAQQSLGRSWLSGIEPLDPPIAGSAVLIVPTRDWLTQVLRDLNPGIPDPDLGYLVDQDEYGALLFAQGIEKRRMFSRTRTVRAGSQTLAGKPAETFVIWQEWRRSKSPVAVRMAGPASVDWTTMEPNESGPDSYDEWLSWKLDTVEEFVRKQAN
jgi:hypothetical protein